MDQKPQKRDFNKIGGLKEHIRILKEMIIYPLLYREVFETYGIEAPRGVLFHGPPGTGKTLTAGAVVAECSKSSNRRVSFYMQKGSECLNKYIGESEKNLQNLFTQAYNTRPSIIFFDEIDGLVPTRSEYHEAHASVVSTLLALMDGLDPKSEVFVIGATNRIDMIDPALRRPGRFDRELYFPLPSLESRNQIFHIHTRKWKHKPSPEFIYKLSCECVGYCGADIQSLCMQAVMRSFHRHFPQVADTSRKYSINPRNLQVEEEDFLEAKQNMVPASQRTYILPSQPLSLELEPLLRRSLDSCMNYIENSCPFKFLFHNREDYTKNKSLTCPRLLLIGKEGYGLVTHIAPAILHHFDHLPVTQVDLTSFNVYNSMKIMQKIDEARQNMPSVLYFRDVSSWWDLIEDTARQLLLTCVESLDTCNRSQIFLLGTVYGSSYEELSDDIKKLFPISKTYLVPEPTAEERRLFFSQLLLEKNIAPPKIIKEVPIHTDPDGSFDGSAKPRTRLSLRQRGLSPDNINMSHVSLPRLGSYYRKYINIPDEANKVRKMNRTEEGDTETVAAKKIKISSDNSTADTGYSDNPSTDNEKEKTLIVDVQRLETLVKEAVDVTSVCSVTSVIRLYEELEIVTLRYSTKWDRSGLPEELEKEISKFSPT